MIRVGTIADMNNNISSIAICENWMIVRSPDILLPYAKHVPQLAPSEELFRNYRKAFHKGVFNTEYFNDIYVPWFLKDMAYDQEAQKLLKTLCEESKNRDYFLGCYCENEKRCHRSLIAGILLGMGALIDTEPDYIKYYPMFRNQITSK